MAKFCIYCGKPLEEGTICDCQLKKEQKETVLVEEKQEEGKIVKEVNEEIAADEIIQTDDVEHAEKKENKTQEIVVESLKGIWNNFIGIIKSPAICGANFVKKEDKKDSWGMIGFHAIINTIFVLLILQKLNSMIASIGGAFGAFSGGFDFGELGQAAEEVLKISLVKGFVLTMILSIALSVLYAGLLFGISKLMKQDCSFQKMLSISAVRSVACIAATGIAIILFILNSFVGISIFFFGELLGICFVMTVMLREMEPDKAVFCVFLAAFIFMIVSSIISVNYIPLYLPGDIKDGFEQLKSYISNPLALYDKFAGFF